MGSYPSILELVESEFQRLVSSSESARYITHKELFQSILPDGCTLNFNHIPTLFMLDYDRDGVFTVQDLQLFAAFASEVSAKEAELIQMDVGALLQAMCLLRMRSKVEVYDTVNVSIDNVSVWAHASHEQSGLTGGGGRRHIAADWLLTFLRRNYPEDYLQYQRPTSEQSSVKPFVSAAFTSKHSSGGGAGSGGGGAGGGGGGGSGIGGGALARDNSYVSHHGTVSSQVTAVYGSPLDPEAAKAQQPSFSPKESHHSIVGVRNTSSPSFPNVQAGLADSTDQTFGDTSLDRPLSGTPGGGGGGGGAGSGGPPQGSGGAGGGASSSNPTRTHSAISAAGSGHGVPVSTSGGGVAASGSFPTSSTTAITLGGSSQAQHPPSGSNPASPTPTFSHLRSQSSLQYHQQHLSPHAAAAAAQQTYLAQHRYGKDAVGLLYQLLSKGSNELPIEGGFDEFFDTLCGVRSAFDQQQPPQITTTGAALNSSSSVGNKESSMMKGDATQAAAATGPGTPISPASTTAGPTYIVEGDLYRFLKLYFESTFESMDLLGLKNFTVQHEYT